MAESALAHFEASDGTRLAYREMGNGLPVVLVHGFLSDSRRNWISYGAAGQLVDAGFRVIMPDLRGHGESDAPHDPANYPAGILVSDLKRLIRHLDVADFHLAGFSLGARVVASYLADEIVPQPRSAVLGGMGLAGMLDFKRRADWFIDTLKRREEGFTDTGRKNVVRFLKMTKSDPDAGILVLGSQTSLTTEELGGIEVPVRVVAGAEDRDNGSGQALAEALGRGSFVEVPGGHIEMVARPEFGAAIVRFFGGH